LETHCYFIENVLQAGKWGKLSERVIGLPHTHRLTHRHTDRHENITSSAKVIIAT